MESTDPSNNSNGSPDNPLTKRNWVKFNEEEAGGADPSNSEDSRNAIANNTSPAVIETSVEIVHENVPQISPAIRPNNSLQNKNTSSSSSSVHPSNNSSSNISSSNINKGDVSNLHNVELRNSESNLHHAGTSGHNIINNGGHSRRNNSGFTNGDVIVSVLPVNTKWPWITPASFRPELVPEELMVAGFTLTVEEFVHAMEILTSDLRFNAYTICYKRLLASWLSAAFFILLIILFSGVVGIGLFALGITWLIINAAAVFLCMYIKIKINQGLERCMAKVNKLLLKHHLIVGLDDRGRLSCHKVHLCFIYFDPTDCIKRLENVLDGMEDRQRVQRHLDSSDVEIVITGQNTTRIPQKQKGERLFLRYVQRWAKDFLRRRLDWTVGEGGENPSAPRHLTSALCPCQYVEEYLRHKPVAQRESSCNWWMPCCPQSTSSS